MVLFNCYLYEVPVQLQPLKYRNFILLDLGLGLGH